MKHYLHNSLRVLFLSLAVLLSLPMLAVEVEIDGIRYDFNAEAKLATVIKKSGGGYSGEVVIPESVEFKGISHSVTSIGAVAFYGCSGLTSVTIPNSVTSIGGEAFFDCINLTSVVLPKNLTRIERRTFYNCSSLNTITIPNTVRSIGVGAIYGCKSLNSIIIPPSVTLIEEYAFQECTGLSSVHISDLTAWCNITFEKMLSNPLYLAGHLFLNGKEIKDLIIPSGVTKIGYAGFCGGAGFTSVSIPNSVTSIGEWAFSYCSGLTSVTIGNGVTSIESDAFLACRELLDVYCYAEKVPSTSSYAFNSSNYSNATLHVPDGSIESYKTTEPWSGFGKIIGLSTGEPEQPEVEKCATPVVTYVGGCLEITCETEGAEFVTVIADSDIKKHYVSKIELSATYNIEVYATKANYENSDTVNVALVWVENGNVDEETGIISVEAAPVLIQGNGGILTVSGVAKDTEVTVYTISGTEVARATAADGTATISTGLQSGTIVVVKFGNKSVKVRI